MKRMKREHVNLSCHYTQKQMGALPPEDRQGFRMLEFAGYLKVLRHTAM